MDLERAILEEIAGVTGMPAGEIETNAPFASLGIESLQAVNILTNLGARLQRELPVTLLFDYPTVKELANFLERVKGARGPLPRLAARSLSEGTAEIAVTGLACRFPGAASPEQFWYNLSFGVDSIRETPPDRWDWRSYPTQPQLRWGGFLDDISGFDHELFGISRPEAEKMDPQQRLLLECVHEAIESAGFSPLDLQRTRTGVFIGISSSDFSMTKARTRESRADVFDATGNAHSIAANRISYIFNLRGPSLSIDTACSSSLVALHEACKSLSLGECDYALVGGVNVILEPEITQAFAEAGMLAPDGRCKTFSQEADGYVRGEGAGVVFLQRLTEASPKKVRAVVRATAVNHEGKTNGLTAPSGPAQEEVIREALGRARLSPDDISFLEAHGTGTALGDPIEFFTLARLFGGSSRRITVGSAKAFVGHLEAAAGVCGLIKVVLALQNRKWPKQIQFTSINPKMQNAAADVQVATRTQSFSGEGVVRAGVSSFGFGGTNAHAILETAPEALASSAEPVSQAGLLVAFSATSEESLKEFAGRWSEMLANEGAETKTAAACEVSRRKRLLYPKRVAFWGSNQQELTQALGQWQSGQSGRWVARDVPRNFQPKVAFIFTGQGSQYPGMGLELAQSDKRFRDRWLEILGFLDGFYPRGLLAVCEAKNPELTALLYRTDYGQALLFSLELALARYLEEVHGIFPELVMGHSLGELSAAAYSGAIPLPEACRLVAARGIFMQERTAEGAMISVRGSAASVIELLGEDDGIELAARNGPDLFTLSGLPAVVEKAIGRLERSGAQVKKLAVERAFHSRLMDSMLSPFGEILAPIRFAEPRLPVLSSLTGLFVQDGEYSPEYWKRQVREPTQFEAMVQSMAEAGITVALEVGPHPVLCAMGPACSKKKLLWLPTLRRGQSSREAGERAVAELNLLGACRENGVLPTANLPLTPFTKSPFPRAVPYRQDRPLEVASPKEEKRAMPTETLLQELQTLVAGLLHLPVAEVDPDIGLIDLGADSLLLLNAIQTIKDRHGVTIAVADVFRELSTLRAIAAYVEAQRPAPAVSVPVATPTAKPIATPPERELLEVEMRAAAASSITSKGLRDLFDRQLLVMQQQLSLLSSGEAGGEATSPVFAQAPAISSRLPESSAVPAPSASGQAKGVLGMFRSKANREVSVEEQAKADYVARFVERFNARTKNTKGHTQRYRQFLADNRVSAGFRPNLKEMIYTTVFRSGRGSHFQDMDGNDYLDLTMGFGVNLFGLCPDFVEARIRQALDQGYCVGPQAELAGIVAEKACKVLGHERVAFLNSGTEAVMTALRLARATTGRNRIVLFEGSYHGHSDVVLARPGSNGHPLPAAPGVPTGLVGDVVVLPYGEESALDYIRKHAHELAAVLVEPVQSRYPEHVPVAFLKEIRAITEKSGTAFLFDEVIFGLRAAPGGAQELFGIKADLAAYGKVLGGGMPIGLVAGKSRFLDPIDGGFWRFGDDSYPQAEMTFFAGTFCKHPVTMAACDAVLDRFLKEGRAITDPLNERTRLLTERLRSLIEGTGIEANSFSSLFRFKSQQNLDLLFANMNLRGLYVWEGRNLFLSTAHTDKDLDEVVRVVGESLEELKREGFIRKKP